MAVNVNASDRDVSNDGFTFWLGQGSDGKFNISMTDGRIYTRDHFDRKSKQHYSLRVFVSDHGHPPKIANKSLSVHITDSNSKPIFDNNSQYIIKVPENTTVGSTIGSVHADDQDFGSSGQVGYYIPSNTVGKNMFSVDHKSGNLTLRKELNFEQQKQFIFKILAIDESYSSKTATAEVTIQVENIPEKPKWPPTIPHVYLTQPSACKGDFSTEVTKLTAIGDEGVEYYLSNFTNEFSIDQSSGLLISNMTLGPGTYDLGVQACSTNRILCSSSVLSIIIQSDDIIAFCPAFYQIKLNESTPVNSILWNFTINKPMSGIKFSIDRPTDEGMFVIGPDTVSPIHKCIRIKNKA